MPLDFAPQVLVELFDSLPLGVVVLDREGRVVVFNAYEERLAARRRERVVGRAFFEEIAPCMNVRELAGVFRERIGTGELAHRVDFSFPFPHMDQPRDVVVRMQSFVAASEPYGVLLVEDVSVQRAIERMRETLSQLLVHDMKNPLAAVLMNLDYLASDASLPSADVQEILGESLEAGQRLQRMILNLLDITRLETGAFPLVRAPVSLSVLVDATVRAAQPQARMRGVEVVGDADAGVVTELDEGALRRALDNLVENALRHTPRGARVIVRATRDGDRVHLDVENRGPGIPDALRERIFEKYVQVTTGSATPSNFGLGLTFVRLVAHAHGGEALVLPAKPHGALFRIALPAATPARDDG